MRRLFSCFPLRRRSFLGFLLLGDEINAQFFVAGAGTRRARRIVARTLHTFTLALTTRTIPRVQRFFRDFRIMTELMIEIVAFGALVELIVRRVVHVPADDTGQVGEIHQIVLHCTAVILRTVVVVIVDNDRFGRRLSACDFRLFSFFWFLFLKAGSRSIFLVVQLLFRERIAD